MLMSLLSYRSTCVSGHIVFVPLLLMCTQVASVREECNKNIDKMAEEIEKLEQVEP